MNAHAPPPELDERSREVFRRIVDAYLETGEPVGSRTLSRAIEPQVSPATIRNVMSDLEHLGLIQAPHVSAGRLPTEAGLRLFVDGLMEVGRLGKEDRSRIARHVGRDDTVETVLTEASMLLSGLAKGAGLVISAKANERLRHIEFVRLEPTRALVVIVGQSGAVENRIVDLPPGLPASALVEASNYLNANIAGLTLAEARERLAARIDQMQHEIDQLSASLIEEGLAVWGGTEARPQLVVRGRSNLLETQGEDLDRLRQLFDELETKEGLTQLLDLAEGGEGVRIFIGSENKLFSLSGSSVVVAPYRDQDARIIGAVGVIGPTRINYARIVPVVDYTAQIVGRILQGTGGRV